VPQSSAWWNSLNAADFDQDGDIDYIAGNLGLNSRHKASPEKPLCIYAKDYDKNGRIDPVFCQYIEDKRYIAHPRDLLIQQINAMRVRFKTYEDYGKSTFEKSFTQEELADAFIVKSENFASSYLENLGNGQFKLHALPVEAQVAPVFGTSIADFNKDGFLDVAMVGNSYATEVAIGRYDAFKGLVLLGDGAGGFEPQAQGTTGFQINKDAKGIAHFFDTDQRLIYLVTSNSDSLKIFQDHLQEAEPVINLKANDQYLIFKNDQGKERRQECYYGATYLSQSTRKIMIGSDITGLTIVNTKGEQRIINLEELNKKDRLGYVSE